MQGPLLFDQPEETLKIQVALWGSGSTPAEASELKAVCSPQPTQLRAVVGPQPHGCLEGPAREQARYQSNGTAWQVRGPRLGTPENRQLGPGNPTPSPPAPLSGDTSGHLPCQCPSRGPRQGHDPTPVPSAAASALPRPTRQPRSKAVTTQHAPAQQDQMEPEWPGQSTGPSGPLDSIWVPISTLPASVSPQAP